MKQSDKITKIIAFMPSEVKRIMCSVIGCLGDKTSSIEEIRFRTNRPVNLHFDGRCHYITNDGKVSYEASNGFIATEYIMENLLKALSQYSLYAHIEEIKKGYMTIKGGHRVGVTGRVVVTDGEIENISDISGINIRIAREVRGAADNVMDFIVVNDAGGYTTVRNTVIVSPPQCGKTTLLRDIARQLSNMGLNVGISDERGEIAACNRGIPQNDLGMNTDVLDGCPKAKGMRMLLRSMSPQVLITDEIVTEEDVRAIRQSVFSGVPVIASIHGNKAHSELKKHGFEQAVILSRRFGAGTIEEVVRLT